MNIHEKLFQAVHQNKIDKVLELIEKGADIEARNCWSNTPLHCACWYGQTELAIALIEKGADVGARDKDGETPFDLASEELKQLIKKKKFQNFINKIKKIFS